MLEKILSPFTFGQMQDMVTVLDHLEKNNVSINAFLSFVARKRIEIIKETSFRETLKNAVLCPECSFPMGLSPVNTNPGDQTGDDSKAVWLCSNRKCKNTVYTTETIEQILSKIRAGEYELL